MQLSFTDSIFHIEIIYTEIDNILDQNLLDRNFIQSLIKNTEFIVESSELLTSYSENWLSREEESSH